MILSQRVFKNFIAILTFAETIDIFTDQKIGQIL